MSEALPLCLNTHRHPGRVEYYLTYRTITADGIREEDRKAPREMLCPWCDWKKLRGNGVASGNWRTKK
jgi:hypothetical protein